VSTDDIFFKCTQFFQYLIECVSMLIHVVNS